MISPSATFGKYKKYMKACVKAQQFSGAVLVAVDGKSVFGGGYGNADAAKDIPNTVRTKFSIASITKQFTAMAILMLQEQGKLRVSDPISKHLSCAPGHWRAVTIHDLLSHTSGIPDFTNLPDFSEFSKTPRRTIDDTIAPFVRKPLEFKPGEQFEYSNSGYNLLGLIIENAAEITYGQFLQREIFGPLAMKNSGLDNLRIDPYGRARGYKRTTKGLKVAVRTDTNWAYAAGGLYSTVTDLLLWETSLTEGTLLSKAALRAMFTPCRGSYGYGWFIDRTQGRKTISHTGGMDGFTTIITRVPSQRFCCVVLSNIENFGVAAQAQDLRSIYFEEPYSLPQVCKAMEVAPERLRDYEGSYELTSEVVITISVERGRIFAQASGQSRMEIFAFAEDKFFMIVLDAQIWFERGRSSFNKISSGSLSSDKNSGSFCSRVTRLVLHQNNQKYKAKRIAVPKLGI